MKKTIKIINLLNMIANGEEVPKKIKYGNLIYVYNYKIKDYEFPDKVGWLMDVSRNQGNEFLNDYVEIIDEEEFEDISVIDEFHDNFIQFENGGWKGRNLDIAFKNKINKLINNQKKIIDKLKNK